MNFKDRVRGSIAGACIGDALGAPTERFSTSEIQARFGGFVEYVAPPFHADYENQRPIAPYYKGDGHITDDSMMIESLISVYSKVSDHLDAFTFADGIIPELIEKKRYIPELQKDDLLIHRLFFAEKWLVHKLFYGHVDPREAGVGNMVNCGAAMYMAPVGAVNAGNPTGAYQEAIEIAGAHQSSFGREAAGAFAASVAQAYVPGTTPLEIADVAIELAHDGTKKALEAVVSAARKVNDWKDAIPVLREAFRPFDTMAEEYREPHLDSRKPSRTLSIEEYPIALGMLIVANGSYRESVLGGVNYGRDADSIASMSGAMAGAMHGIQSIPADWLETVERESKRDFSAISDELSEVALKIQSADRIRAQAVREIQNSIFDPSKGS
jgi:ADP-ribosylglycohydrolase